MRGVDGGGLGDSANPTASVGARPPSLTGAADARDDREKGTPVSELRPDTRLTVEDTEDALLEGDRPFAPGTARAALSYRVSRRVFVGALLSNIGSWMQNVVLGAYGYSLTHSATFVSLLSFAQLVPLMLLSMVGGALADRFDRKWLIILVSIEQTAFALGIAWLTRSPTRRSSCSWRSCWPWASARPSTPPPTARSCPSWSTSATWPGPCRSTR